MVSLAQPMDLHSLTGASRFESVMASRPLARSAHFMVHHIAQSPLSKSQAQRSSRVVDKSVSNSVEGPVDNRADRPEAACLRLGLVVPKRHARRSVTRTLVKGQIRAGMRRHLDVLTAGDWVVRLRAPIDRKQFPSARSEALAALLHGELDVLLADAARRARRAQAPAELAPDRAA